MGRLAWANVRLDDGDVAHVRAIARKRQPLRVAALLAALGVEGFLELRRVVRALLECCEVLGAPRPLAKSCSPVSDGFMSLLQLEPA